VLRGGFAGAALLLIAGCAGAASQKQGEAGVPVLEEMTGKAADRVAGCIVDSLEAQDSSLTQTTFSATQTFDGYSITGTQRVAVSIDIILLIDVVRIANQTRVRMYTHFLVGKGPSTYFRAVRGCL
jgi:hypothetical protein